jgi:integrase/recombinase XerC
MPRLAKPLPATVTLANAADLWHQSLRSDNKSPRTIHAYTYAIKTLTAFLGPDRPLDQITRADHERLMGDLFERGWKPASVSTVYRPLRSFWKWAARHDDMPVSKDPMNGMQAPVVPEKTVEFVTDDELRAIIKTCQSKSRHNYLGHRDEAIIRLLATTAARLSEITELTLSDVDLIGATVRVMGKGRRERFLPLDDATLTAVKRYLDKERPRHPSARSTDKLWLARAGQMTPSGIAQLVAERGVKASIGHRVHPHELRHRQIATLLGAGFSEGDVMALSGHRSRSMMDRYGRYTRSARAHDAFRRATAAGALPRL